MLTQDDLERERYEARVKLQRDELTRMISAREEGLELGRKEGEEIGRKEGLLKGQLVGMIQVYQKILKQHQTPTDQLLAKSVEELQQLSQQLQEQLKPVLPENGTGQSAS